MSSGGGNFSGNGARGSGRGRGRGQGDWAISSSPHSGNIAGRDRGRGQFQGPPWRGSGAPSPLRGANRGAGRGRGGQPGGAIFMQDQPSTVDARIKDDSDRAVVATLHSSSTGTGSDADTGAHPLPLRPDFGTKGREISLRANYFPVEVQGRIFRYSAEIVLSNSKKLSRRLKQRVFRLAEQTVDWQQAGMVGHVAHDSAEKLVASIELSQPLTIRGIYFEEDEDEKIPSGDRTTYTVTLTFEEEVDQELLNRCLAGEPVDSQALSKVLSALNLVLAAHPSRTGVKIGRNDDAKKHPDQRLFFSSPEPKDIGGGLTVRSGFYTSVRPTHHQLMVNVNTCHAAFYKPQNFVDAMREYRQFVNGNIGAFGSQVRVTTRPNNHIVMIQGMSERNALQHKFKYDKYGWITIAKYYDLKHNIKLVHPHLPLLEGPNGNVYPQEVCDILPDQGFKAELTNKKHAKNMLDAACKPPKENADEIVNRGLDVLGFRDPDPLLNSFGIRVGTEMAVVPGRILDKPRLLYSSNASVSIDNRASWNLRDVKFAAGARVDKWAVLVVQDNGKDDFRDIKDPALRTITDGFRGMCNKSGMQLRLLEEKAYAQVQLPSGKTRFRDEAIREMERILVTLKEQVKPEFVLVMLSDDDKAVYNGLKWLCDVKLDIATVCMQSSKVRQDRGRPQYYANVALKVNMKMGGINHTLDPGSGAWLRSAPTMIMGMDVTHPTGGGSADGAPSVLAVVASIDEHFAQYPAALAIRNSKVEIERNGDDNVLRNMFISRFELYKARNQGALPKRVILYRDGVSESQFVQVRDHELPEMQKAFKDFGSYQPKLSIVVCGKRHNTRFYPTRGQDAALDGNPLPGTVVDRGVTPAYEFDFFLQAHGGLKGTTRPTHYYVVHDENGFNADDLQGVTNDLSYMFARATKAVSLVSAAYWADIACERGRCYLHRLLQGGSKEPQAGEDKGKKGKKRAEDTVFAEAERMWGGGVSGPKLQNRMFYL